MGGNEAKVEAVYGNLQVSFFAEVGPQGWLSLAAKYTREGEGHAQEGWQIEKDVDDHGVAWPPRQIHPDTPHFHLSTKKHTMSRFCLANSTLLMIQSHGANTNVRLGREQAQNTCSWKITEHASCGSRVSDPRVECARHRALDSTSSATKEQLLPTTSTSRNILLLDIFQRTQGGGRG